MAPSRERARSCAPEPPHRARHSTRRAPPLRAAESHWIAPWSRVRLPRKDPRLGRSPPSDPAAKERCPPAEPGPLVSRSTPAPAARLRSLGRRCAPRPRYGPPVRHALPLLALALCGPTRSGYPAKCLYPTMHSFGLAALYLGWRSSSDSRICWPGRVVFWQVSVGVTTWHEPTSSTPALPIFWS